MSIGNQISAIRNEQQLTQERFGELFHVTRQTVSNWENENKHAEDRRTPEDKNADCYLETVENKCKEILGTAKTRCT